MKIIRITIAAITSLAFCLIYIDCKAQQKFYNTPNGAQIRVVPYPYPYQECEFSMEAAKFYPGDDGLMIKANYDFRSINAGSMSKLIDLTDKGVPVITLFYKDNTISIRRYQGSAAKFFDYILFDPMFNSSRVYFTIKFYIASGFIWFQVNTNDGTLPDWVAYDPLFFGMNYHSGADYMTDFANGSKDAKVHIYNLENQLFPGGSIFVYSFNYNALQNNINLNFSAK